MSIPGKEIFRHYDEYGAMRVVDDGQKRYLAFGLDDEQSCQLKSDPYLLQHDYARAMLLVLLFARPRGIILFGLGGGCLATTLHEYIPELQMRVVELRPQVVKVARRFFHFPSTPRISVQIMDVSVYLENTAHNKTDIVFSDIFGADGLDLQQTQSWYIESCAKLLNDDGWLVLNCWKVHRGEREMIEALKEHFSDVRGCDTEEGNWVIFAGKKTCGSSATQLQSAAKELSKTLGFSLLPMLKRLQSL